MAESKYAVSLPGVPDKLRALSARLKIDSVIKQDLNDIIEEAVKCAGTFCKNFKENSEELRIQSELVKQADKPKDVNVKSLQKALANTKTCFTTSRMDILQLQTKVHAQIENCRDQVKKHTEEQATKKTKVSNKKADIKRLKETIERNENDARDLDKAARELRDRADELNKMEEQKAKGGLIGQIISTAVGVVLVPFTGGLSLLVGTAAGAVIAGVNLHDAYECNKSASSCRSSACDKRSSANNLRDDVRKQENTVDKLETEIGALKERIAVLEDAIRALGDVTSFLRSSIGVSDEVIDAIQTMDTTITDTLLKGSTFFIARKSTKERIANEQMQKLREKAEARNKLSKSSNRSPRTHLNRLTAL